MLLDNVSLLAAVGFSSITLMVTLVLTWVSARRDTYLVNWAVGIALVVLGVGILGARGGKFDPAQQLIAYLLLLAGVAIVYAGARQFRTGLPNLRHVLVYWLPLTGALAGSFSMGLSGVGTIVLNIGCAVFMILSARQYWLGRAEFVLPLIANSLLYLMMAVSFLACAIVPLMEARWVMTGPPDNWAESINSIAAIIGLTGIGALSLTLNQSRAARRHRQDAMTDVLTGLLNRRAVFDRFAEDALPKGTSVLMFDLDHFKQINDHMGHAAGDKVLEAFAGILKAHTGPDDIVARLGGEEFCIVLAGKTQDAVKATAEIIRCDFADAHIDLGTASIRATVSVGIAIAGKGENFPSTLSRADGALYKAKQSGRNRIHTASLRLVA